MNIYKKRHIFKCFVLLGFFGILAIAQVLTTLKKLVYAQSPISFIDVTDRLDFIHFSDGGDGLAGAAWFDYNNDGSLDLFLTNGKGHANGLMRNNGDGTFTNVSSEAGVENGLGNSGVVAGDIDNDGNKDIFLTGEGGIIGTGHSTSKLYHNNGDGTFTDITIDSGIIEPGTALSAAFGDIDNDGFLDLFISGGGSLPEDILHKNKLFHNNGNLTFTDISEMAGVDTALGGCAVGFCDYNNDGWVDIFNANCADPFIRTTPIELFHNNGNLTFTDVTSEAGLDQGGFWMGLTFGDYDNDGDMDVFSTNIGKGTQAWLVTRIGGGGQPLPVLYENNGNGTFVQKSFRAGVAKWEFGWGCSFTDFDNDGYTDLFFAGSFPPAPFFVIGPGIGNPGRLFINNGNKRFTEISTDSGIVDLSDQYTSGVAVADFDNNGFPDIVVGVDTFGHHPGKPPFFLNIGNENNWLTIKIIGTLSNRDGVGARVKVTSGDLTQIKDVHAGTSFLSMDSPWLTFGLGQRDKVDVIEVSWPSGLVEQFEEAAIKQITTLVEGEGILLK